MRVKGANLGYITIYGWSRIKIVQKLYDHLKKIT